MMRFDSVKAGGTIAMIIGILLGIFVPRLFTRESEAVAQRQPEGHSSEAARPGDATGAGADKKTRGADEIAMRKRIRARMENLRELGIIAPENAPDFVLVGEDGQLTNEAIRRANLSATQIGEVQRSIDRALNKASEMVADLARYDESASDPEKGIFRFEVPSFREAGEVVINQLKADLSGAAGDSANLLIASFQPSVYVVGFGKYEADITILTDPRGGENQELRATFVFRDPASGAMIRRGETTQAFFKKYFGAGLQKRISFEE